MQIRTGVLLLLIGLIVVAGSMARADRDIVYAAQCYRWSGHLRGFGSRPERTLEEVSHSHLFRINPDGTGRTQLTFSHFDDTSPRFSPDGKHILFLREESYSPHSLCRMDADGGTVTTLLRFPLSPKDKYTGVTQVDWSQDGRMVGYILDEKLILLNLVTHQKRVLPNIDEYGLSLDGQHLYLETNQRPRLLDLHTGAVLALKNSLLARYWLDNTHLIGIVEKKISEEQSSYALCILNMAGSVQRQIDVTENDWGDGSKRTAWHPTQAGSSLFIRQDHHHSTGGGDNHCSLLNLHTGHSEDLHAGRLIAVSPDGQQAAITNDDWIGPYKAGGRRAGALEVISLTDKKAKSITSELMYIHGGDWRKALGVKHSPSPSITARPKGAAAKGGSR